eukprot:g3595.t1
MAMIAAPLAHPAVVGPTRGLAAVDPLRCSKASANGALTATTVAVVARHKRVRKILAKAEKEETEDVKDSAESTKTSGFRRWWKKSLA